MKYLCFTFFLAVSCKATFVLPQPVDAYDVCIFSVDPSQYPPSCFPCPKNIYNQVLKTCVNGTSMPSNITYTSANCVDKNCKINYPEAKTVPPPFDAKLIMESLAKILRVSRSVEDNTVYEYDRDSMTQKEPPVYKIIGHIKAFASDMEVELDYSVENS